MAIKKLISLSQKYIYRSISNYFFCATVWEACFIYTPFSVLFSIFKSKKKWRGVTRNPDSLPGQ